MANKEIEHRRRLSTPEGVILGEDLSTVTIRSATVADFYMTFAEFVNPVHRLKSANDISVLGMLCKYMDYNNQANLTTKARKEICEVIGISSSVFSRSLASLKEKGFITGEEGVFDINPFIFWKGSSKEREKLLKGEGLALKLNFIVEKDAKFSKGNG